MSVKIEPDDFSTSPPASGVKLLALRPTGLPKFSPPFCVWLARHEDEMAAWWFDSPGQTDVDAIQVIHANGQITSIFRDTLN